MEHIRCQQRDSTVMVLVVVPGKETLTKGTCVLDGAESVGELGPVPDMLHYGTASQIIEQRQNVLDQAYVRNPERFVRANSYQFKSFHHDVLALPNGHWVLLACYNKQYSNFGGVADNADALGDALVDVDENGNPDWVWNTFDHWTSIVIQ